MGTQGFSWVFDFKCGSKHPDDGRPFVKTVFIILTLWFLNHKDKVMSYSKPIQSVFSALWIIFAGVFSPLAMAQTPVHTLAEQVGADICADAIKAVEKDIFKDLKYRTHQVTNSQSPKDHAFSTLSILQYNGDDSHVMLTASPSAGGGCDVVYLESYSWYEDCITTRIDGFRKFKQLGKMNESLVLQYLRDPQLMAYLTPQKHTGTCLVTKRKVYYAQK